MKILQINTTVNSGSTGRIAEDIGLVLMENGHESYIAYGRGDRPSQSNLIKIGDKKDVYLHALKTMVFDKHAFGSKKATIQLVQKIEEIKPDAIGLHNLHGYYLNIDILFNYLEKSNVPVLWTLFDCWSFTGHCSYFDDINCTKWKSHCNKCPKTKKYPSSYVFDRSFKNFAEKRNLFTKVKNLEIVAHSKWLQGLISESFLSEKKVHHIFSGIDLDIFSPKNPKDCFNNYPQIDQNKSIILGVASVWDKRKGLEDFIELSAQLSEKYQLILVGLSQKQVKQLPKNIIGITRTENISQLASLYSVASVFVNPTYQDNFPTTNIEALACGTPVITYNTGGSPEAIDQDTGVVVDKGDINGLVRAIKSLGIKNQDELSSKCRQRALENFNKKMKYSDYLDIFETLIKN